MSYVVTAQEMRRADENTITRFGVPQFVLMERAALSAQDFIIEEWQNLFTKRVRILIVAGNGNNGGDGVALARLFYLQGHRVTVLVSGKEEKYSDALTCQMRILERYKAEEERQRSTNTDRTLEIITDDMWEKNVRQSGENYELVVDALFGVGLSRPLNGADREKVEWMNSLHGKKAALDIPSGVSAQDGSIPGGFFQADLTVTFGFQKTGMLLYPGKEFCGKIRCAGIGITEDSFLGKYPAGITLDKGEAARKECLDTFLHRKKNSHKGNYGKVLLFAGSTKSPGAALLAGRAVLRSGAGMLQFISTPENRDLILSELPEAMYQAVTRDTDWDMLLDWCDAVIAGPGIGLEKETGENLWKIMTLMSEAKERKPLVLDADGLNLAASSERLFRLIKQYTAAGGIVIMTPHMAEFARLLHSSMEELQAERMKKLECFARESGVILAGKDAVTVVCYADEAGQFHYYINQTGNSGMATAGSGDVLSGIVGALTALCAVRLREQGNLRGKLSFEENFTKKAYFEAVYRAVFVHGLAGDRAAEKYGEISMKAGDIIDALPELFDCKPDVNVH